MLYFFALLGLPRQPQALRAASPVAEAQRSLKTEQRALRGSEQLTCGMFEPDPFGAPARRMVLIYLVMSVAVFVYSAAN